MQIVHKKLTIFSTGGSKYNAMHVCVTNFLDFPTKPGNFVYFQMFIGFFLFCIVRPVWRSLGLHKYNANGWRTSTFSNKGGDMIMKCEGVTDGYTKYVSPIISIFPQNQEILSTFRCSQTFPICVVRSIQQSLHKYNAYVWRRTATTTHQYVKYMLHVRASQFHD